MAYDNFNQPIIQYQSTFVSDGLPIGQSIQLVPSGSLADYQANSAAVQTLKANIDSVLSSGYFATDAGKTLLSGFKSSGVQIVVANSPQTIYKQPPIENNQALDPTAATATVGNTVMLFNKSWNNTANDNMTDNAIHEIAHIVNDLMGEMTIDSITHLPQTHASVANRSENALQADITKLWQTTDGQTFLSKFPPRILQLDSNGTIVQVDLNEISTMLISFRLGATDVPSGYYSGSLTTAELKSRFGNLFSRLDGQLTTMITNKEWGSLTKAKSAPTFYRPPTTYSRASFGDFGVPEWKKNLIAAQAQMQEGGQQGRRRVDGRVKWTLDKAGMNSETPEEHGTADGESTSPIASAVQASMAQIHEGFNRFAQSPSFDPLFVDLMNDGILLSGSFEGIYLQQSEDDAFAFSTSWLLSGTDDGVLFLDSEDLGDLVSADQIFGEQFRLPNNSFATNGFEALASLDSNEDGVINESDELFDKIKVAFANEEVATLEELGIVSIDLDYTSTNVLDSVGNRKIGSTTFTYSDASTSIIADYDLAVNTTFSAAVNILEETLEIAELPDLDGFGVVYSLHQTMLRDQTGVLQDLVEQFVAETNPVQQEELVQKIIFQWTGVTGLAENYYGPHVNARAVAALSKLTGDSIEIQLNGTQSIGVVQADNFMGLFNKLTNLVYGQLMIQTELSDLFDLISFDQETQLLDLSDASEAIADAITLNESAGTALLSKFHRAFTGIGLDQVANYHEFYATFAAMDPEYAWLMDSAGYETVIGSNGSGLVLSRVNDGEARAVALKAGTGGQSLFSSGQSVLYGNTGNDSIYAGYVKDLINAGAGDDSIYLRGGESTLIFNRGDGQDQVFEYFPVGLGMTDNIAEHDILNFGAQIALEDLVFNPISNISPGKSAHYTRKNSLRQFWLSYNNPVLCSIERTKERHMYELQTAEDLMQELPILVSTNDALY